MTDASSMRAMFGVNRVMLSYVCSAFVLVYLHVHAYIY